VNESPFNGESDDTNLPKIGVDLAKLSRHDAEKICVCDDIGNRQEVWNLHCNLSLPRCFGEAEIEAAVGRPEKTCRSRSRLRFVGSSAMSNDMRTQNWDD
jgi:hypothetical protein